MPVAPSVSPSGPGPTFCEVAHQGFYEVSATVIPVLFLALIFQMEWFGQDGDTSTPRFDLFDLVIVLFAGVGELICIVALSEGRTPSHAEKLVVGVAIGMLFLPAIVRAARPRFRSLAASVPWTKPLGSVVAAIFPIVVVGCAVAQIRIVPAITIASLILLFVVSVGGVFVDDYQAGKRLRWPRRRGRN
jgi:hypothetical protein